MTVKDRWGQWGGWMGGHRTNNISTHPVSTHAVSTHIVSTGSGYRSGLLPKMPPAKLPCNTNHYRP